MSLTVQLRGLSGSIELDLDEGATINDVREAAAENGTPLDGMTLRADGQTVSDGTYTVRDGQILVSTPPEAKHGRR